jgi:PAT family beta-lactamase induction signal transducer AmpG
MPPISAAPSHRSAWFWVPSLYFSQGIPYVIVMTLSVVMYKRLGISNTDIALYTSWLYLPWVIKPIWSPLVDITLTKRFWVVSMQFLISVGLALAAFSIRGSAFFKTSLFIFWVMAFSSATHDIAADGFYMLSMTKHEQAWWVGLRSTFYRTAMIVGSGLLVVLAGLLETRNGLEPVECHVQAGTSVPDTGPSPAGIGTAVSSVGQIKMLLQPASLEIPRTTLGVSEARAKIGDAKKWNLDHGFVVDSVTARKETSNSWWSRNVSGPIRDFLAVNFPRKAVRVPEAGNIGIVAISLSSAPSAGQELVLTFDRKKRGLEYFGLAKGDKGFRLLEGDRFVFNSTNWNQGAHAIIQLDRNLAGPASVTFVAASGNISVAWSVTLFVVAGLFLAFSCWHSLMLPRPANDGPVRVAGNFARGFFETLGSFFQKPGAPLSIAFILLYRFDEAQLVKVISPFLLDGRETGGLGLTTSQVGLAYGTFGVLALTCGGLLGGFAAARHGLKRMLPIMVASMYLPKLSFFLLSTFQPENFLITCGAVALEQFGYGFGFTAFMLYMLYFADGPHKTAHYALCTGFMALGMMVPGMWSGWLVDIIGYRHFFIWVICSALPGLTLSMLLKVDPQFGRKTPA